MSASINGSGGATVNGASGGGGAPTGPASGDLGSTYPGPTVTSGAHHTHAAGQVTGLGALATATQPTTLAAQQRLDAQLRRGPLATLGTAATTAGAGTPSIARGTSGALVVYSTQASAYAGGSYLLSSTVAGARGWFICILAGTSSIAVAGVNGATASYPTFTNVLASIGWHSVAWSISSDGATVRYSVDGGAAASATITNSPWTAVARNASDPVWILADGATLGSALPVAYLGLWSSVLSDADLVLLSADASEGAPDLAAISGGAPAWEWAAAPTAVLDRIKIAGDTYAVTSTRPQTWMP